MEKIQALADSLSILTPFEGLLIVVSGDVAGKGLAQEYNLAERFVLAKYGAEDVLPGHQQHKTRRGSRKPRYGS